MWTQSSLKTPATKPAFHHLKEAIAATPVLALPEGIVVVLMQEGHPLSYPSKA